MYDIFILTLLFGDGRHRIISACYYEIPIEQDVVFDADVKLMGYFAQP